jgi:hypothetical protein
VPPPPVVRLDAIEASEARVVVFDCAELEPLVGRSKLLEDGCP